MLPRQLSFRKLSVSSESFSSLARIPFFSSSSIVALVEAITILQEMTLNIHLGSSLVYRQPGQYVLNTGVPICPVMGSRPFFVSQIEPGLPAGIPETDIVLI
ncbi:hypothetical protein D3C77_525020 [compost metagenome]